LFNSKFKGKNSKWYCLIQNLKAKFKKKCTPRLYILRDTVVFIFEFLLLIFELK